MKFKSNPSMWNETVANLQKGCAAFLCTWPTREIGLVAQALLPVRVLSAPREKRTGRSACATYFVLLLFCSDMRGAQSRMEQVAPQESVRVSNIYTDEIGRRVRIPREVDRVVSLAPNLTEIVFALGDGNHLAGDTDFCDYPAEALQKPHVGGPVNPNLEVVVSLMPDLVLATKSINRRETVNALDHIGLPVYVTDPHSVEEMVASVEHLGSALGAEKSATMLAGDLRGRLSDLDRRLAGAAPRRVFFVVWTDPLISVGRDTFIADALRRAGGRSVVNTKAEWPHVSLEEIVRLQPEVLVFASAHAGDSQRDIDALRTRPGWKNLAAMQHGNIVVVSDAINRPAPRMVDAIERLARALHPEAFTSRAAPPEDGGAGFSLWGFVSARTNPHRLKPVPPPAADSDPITTTPLIEEACACAR
jgi:iron complex transport system substrate-binding protein